MTGYAIVCDARAGASLGVSSLALVDRSKAKHLWWTSDDPTIALRYDSEAAAQFAMRRLRHNRPRVVPFAKAAAMLQRQAASIDHEASLAESEMGWDAHKGA